MAADIAQKIDKFQFRNLHPKISIGTASDRYAGWIGQIYSKDQYENKIKSRSKKLADKSFKENVLPVESVEEYFQHFSFLELDFTFYRLLLNGDLQPTTNYHVLSTYKKYLTENDKITLKVPQVIFAKKLWRSGKFIENKDYLATRVFIDQFYQPALEVLGNSIKGFIFEQEYHVKKERLSPSENAEALDIFFDNIPEDDRYHIELRTSSYLSKEYFKVLEKYGIGQVLSHWTWLPPLSTQMKYSNGEFFNSDNQCIIRLMTPRNMRYEDCYKKAFPFDKEIEGMMNSQMVDDSVEITRFAIDQDIHVNITINNRAGGNAPIIAQEIAKRFMED
jgi:uncharacterized protein YecE (DUF72 family)